MATYASILAWRIPWTEEPDGLQFMESQRVRHDWATHTHYNQGNMIIKSYDIDGDKLESGLLFWITSSYSAEWLWGCKTSPVHPFSVFSPKPPWELSRSGTHLSNIRHIQQFPKHVDTRGLQHLVDECGQRCPLGRLGQKQKLLLVLPCHLDLGTHVGAELGEPGLRKSGAARKEDGKLESTRPRGWISEALSHFVTTE